MENEVKYTTETPFGWKGSLFCGLLMLTGLFGSDSLGETCLILSGAFAWFGWAGQEYEHLNGYVIIKK